MPTDRIRALNHQERKPPKKTKDQKKNNSALAASMRALENSRSETHPENEIGIREGSSVGKRRKCRGPVQPRPYGKGPAATIVGSRVRIARASDRRAGAGGGYESNRQLMKIKANGTHIRTPSTGSRSHRKWERQTSEKKNTTDMRWVV